MYKISAVIEKDGGAPVEWTHYTKIKKTEKECIKLFRKVIISGKSYDVKVRFSNFKCEHL